MEWFRLSNISLAFRKFQHLLIAWPVFSETLRQVPLGQVKASIFAHHTALSGFSLIKLKI
jgi:hypothetical protein